MCVMGLGAMMGLGGAGAAAATGAAAAANTLTTLGTLVSVGGSVISGIQGAQTASAQAAALEEQAQTEAQIVAGKDQRERQEMMSVIARQRAELAARGVQLDSVTAVALGQSAAQEMAFQSQSTRQTGAARQTELSAAGRAAKAGKAGSLLKGIFSAADTVFTAAPDLWPGLKGASA